MNARLKRPLLALVVSSALLAGGAAISSPAYADDRDSVTDVASVLADEPGAEPTVDPATPDPTDSDPTAEPTTPPTTEQPTTEPTGDPTTEPPTSEPTTDPTTEPPTSEPTTPPTSNPPSDPPTTPAPVDTKAPWGSVKLDHYYSWIGQAIVVSQVNVGDDLSKPEKIKRVINWGDGTKSTLAANQKITKRYNAAKTYTISFQVTDEKGKSSKAFTTKAVVTKPGTYKQSAYSAWLGQTIKFTLGGVPSGTTRIEVDHGDGYFNNLAVKNQSFNEIYYHRKNGGLVSGKVTVKVRFTNKYGASAWLYAGAVTIKKDSWAPVVKVTKPAKSTSAKAWKTVKGTVTDKGSGAPYVYVWVSRIVGSKVYCYTPKKTWKRVYTQDQYNNCEGLAVKQSKGKWSVKLSSLPKGGTLYVDAIASDWADRQSKWASVKAKLSKA